MTYQKYQFTAFTEADLLQGVNGSSIGRGDCFVMPTSASVCMTTYDNDSTLSGDNWCNENANDSTGQKAIVDGARVGSQMYAESYHVLRGSDGKIYYLIEIEVEGYNAPGQGDDFFTFYGAVPPAGVSLTVVNTCNVRGNWVDFKCLGAGEKAPLNEPPTFTNVPSDGIICVDENTTFVIDLAADDADGDTLTYEIVGGRDAAFFDIDPQTGELTFKGAPDYENPMSGGNSNTYDVTVKVSDGNGGSETKPLWIKVKDVDESTGGTCIVIEAEDMQLCGYRVEDNGNASGGQVVKGSVGCWGYAKTTFDGASDSYDLKLSVIDENDGQGWIYIYVNGQDVSGPIRLDQDNGGNGVSNSTFREIVLNDIQLDAGDVIKIWGYGQGCEFVRLDKLEICSDGDPMTAELGDRVWFDADKDGIQDAGEAGIAGITVLLKDAAGNTLATTTTDANGDYLFSGLAAGDYKVCVVPANGLVFTGQDAGNDAADSDVDATGMTGVITLAEGESNLTVDAGLVDPGTASLSGRVFCDDNNNDVDDSEPGVGGVTVTLLTAAGAVVATAVTAADGSYSFTGLDAGDYKVMFDESTAGGKTLVDQNVGGDDTVDSDADASGMTGVYTLAIGGNVTDVDAGVETVPGSLSGTYFCDENRDGLDNDNSFVAGVTVELLDANGQPTGASTTTDANGNYSFGNLAPGTYGVKFTDTVSGKVLTQQDVDRNMSDDIDSDASDLGNGMSQITGITVVSGQDTPDNDAGVVQPNTDPVPVDDVAKFCADMVKDIDILFNDTDADGDVLSVTSISDADETVGVGGTLTLASGATVTLNADGTVTHDGVAVHGNLLVGQEVAEESISYTVSDGNGGTGTGNLDITVCGAKATLQMICDALPAQVDLSISLTGSPLNYQVTVVDDPASTLDDGLASAIWSGQCIDINGMLVTDQVITANIYGPCDTLPAGLIQFPENLDNIGWLINQDLVGTDNGSGGTWSVFDVQEAVWILSDGTSSSNAAAQTLAQQALNAGEGWVAQEGDLVPIVFDPVGPIDVNGFQVTDTQTFIMGVDWEAIDPDCIC